MAGTRIDRRRLLQGAGVAGAALSAHASAAALAPGALEVAGLKAQGLTDPIGLDDRAPRLSWRIESRDRGVRQTHYRIEAASSAELLRAGKPDLWDSGEVASAASLDIPYAGKPLGSRAIVYWRVTVRDTRGRTSTSPMARWEMALLDVGDWQAKWIAAETAMAKGDREAGLLWVRGDRSKDKTPRYFRLAFDLPKTGPVTLISVCNFPATVWVDGEQVNRGPNRDTRSGSEPPAVTTHQLSAGRHVVAVAVKDPRGFNERKLHECATALMLRAEGPDGTFRLTTKGTRTTLHAPEGWQAVAFDDSGWPVAEPSKYQLQAFPGCGAFLLRRGFAVAKPIARARLYATALGAFEAEINGKRVGDALMTPESTDYRDTVLYRAYDVTSLLRPGANAIGAMLTDGWYGSFHGLAGRFAFGPPPLRLLAQLELIYADGSTEIIATDGSWRLSEGAPVVKSEIYYGEDYDARRAQPGWSSAGFDESAWRPVEIGAGPPCEVKANAGPPLRRVRTVPLKNVKQVGPDTYTLDFGQNFAGWVRIKAKGEAGRKLTLRFAEILNPDGSVSRKNLRTAEASCSYIFRGESGVETYEPHFTYFGFRYVELTGLGRAPTVEEFEGVVVSSDLGETSMLRVENPIITGMWRNTLWSQRSNFFGIPTDCPQRDERLGWTGDAMVFWDAAAFNMDVAAFTRRYLRDMRDAQGPQGEYPDYAPSGWRDYSNGTSPGWADAGVILPWTVWQRYGDTAIIGEHWQSMTRYLDYLRTNNPDLIWRNKRGYDYGDWVAFDAKEAGDETTPKALIATAMWQRSAAKLAEMAAATGRTAEAKTYATLAADIARAFQRDFVGPDGSVGNGSHCSYILALHFGLVPERLRAAAAAKLVADIRRRGTLISTGFLGTPYSLDALADAGQEALVYDLLLRTALPSWGHMIAAGATTIWERWNADTSNAEMNSYNHYALGAVNGFVFRRIAGIDPLAPGFARWRFDPVLDPRVPKGGARYDSPMGRIETAWELQAGGGFIARIHVPANTVAELHLPAGSEARVREGGQPLTRATSVTVKGMRGSRLLVEAGSGDYAFSMT
ncbi:glycoside hydrolase family 78 protein [Sphingomonas sp. BT-65]|uniref:alpha-L-rhamnosidase n=1 Tax=Sphingomonas sp. BT-65 TaxID=2989821 RepID=UPI00223666CB|nr:alpha-L-rhamnosidase [Sphingomonas sp. BT-65]MCW4462793.1 glycoside hydrolase family 78 protein [Sphingomonas sp. BT-65]